MAVGWSDLYAAIMGSGALDRDGAAFDITGTAEGIGATGPHAVHVGGLVSMPVVEGRAVTYGSTQAGCGAVEWWLRVDPRRGVDGPEGVDAAAASVLDQPSRVLFLPHLGGERAPLWDTTIRGAFLGWTSRRIGMHCRAPSSKVFAFSIRQVLELAQGTVPSTGPVRVAGAAAGSRVWNQIKANVLGRPIEAVQARQASSLGGAMLAAIAAGLYRSVAEISPSMLRPTLAFEPERSRVEAYEPMYAAYVAAQRDLANVHETLRAARSADAR